jgi:hypothetical protein
MRRSVALATFTIAFIACGSHVTRQSDLVPPEDASAAVQRDLPALISGARAPTYAATS